MNCDWIEIVPTTDGRRVVQCSRCLKRSSVPESSSDRITRECPVRRGPGVGDHLRAILKTLGINPDNCGGECAKMMAKMNQWGADGCLEHIEEIVFRLRKAYSKTDWLTIQRARLAAVVTGLAWELDTNDVPRSLGMLAIKRVRTTPPENQS